MKENQSTSMSDNKLHPGAILHSWDILQIDHGKFFVIMGIKRDSVIGFFFINSNINKFLENKPEQFALQYPLRAADYSFLRYDSFLCASNLKEIDKSTIRYQLENHIAEIVYELKENHFKEICEICRKSRLFTPAQKKDFFTV